MIETLDKIKNKTKIGIVSGNSKAKFIGILGQQLFNQAEYSFTQNGLVSYQKGQNIHTKSIQQWFGDETLKKFVNFCLHYIADLDIPIKRYVRTIIIAIKQSHMIRGTFFELRTGLLNVSPIGRNCSYAQRLKFFEYDTTHKVRQKFIQALKKEFPQLGVQYSIGGQISFDVYPKGWDKRYCLQFVEKMYDKVYFFGDRVKPGGNDYQIYEDKRTSGYQVKGPDQTCQILEKLFLGGE